MKRTLYVGLVMILVAAVAMVAFAGSKGTLDLKAGDEIYACNCGDACDCLGMSRNPGKCTCGKEMVKAKVESVKDGTAMLKATGWDKPRAFKTTGKYVCACPPECKCDTIAQKPGKCTCGVEMKKVGS